MKLIYLFTINLLVTHVFGQELISLSSIGLSSTVHSMVYSDSDSEPETPTSFSQKVRKSKHLDSGVKQLFLLALAPGVKECYENLKLILDALKVFVILAAPTMLSHVSNSH